jgi:hypothetical protein
VTRTLRLSASTLRDHIIVSPVRAGKVPVVLIHGLWGFSHQSNPIVADLEADPLLRERYQFWTFSYANGDPIPLSAHLPRQSLRQAWRAFDPNGTDVAFDRMVVVGLRLLAFSHSVVPRPRG